MLLRSRDDLQQQLGGCLPSKQFTGEDQWFSKEKLYKVRRRKCADNDGGADEDGGGGGEFSKGAAWSSVEFSRCLRVGSFYSLSGADLTSWAPLGTWALESIGWTLDSRVGLTTPRSSTKTYIIRPSAQQQVCAH